MTAAGRVTPTATDAMSVPRPRATVRRPRRRPRATRLLLLVLVASLIPLPWMQGGLRHGSSRPLVLEVDGRTLATDDLRYLTVLGYYPLGQALWDQLIDDPSGPPRDLFNVDPPDWLRPVVNEPVAAAMGHRAAGVATPLRLRIEGEDPATGQRVVVDRFNGVPIRTGRDLLRARERVAPEHWSYTSADGTEHTGAPSDTLQRLQLRWDSRVTAHTTGGVPFGHVAALREPVRDLPVGASHTLIVAIASYQDASGEDLTRGRRVAATGALDPLTGAVNRIGGLRLKAEAAHQDGVNVLLFPAGQDDELRGLATPGMRRIGVGTLDEAIVALR